ncbi:hypothetical protein ACXR2U_08195 [Jatrophihabitans sp. YIM 134969]
MPESPPPSTVVWLRRLVVAQIVIAVLAIVAAVVLAAIGSSRDEEVVGGLSVFLAVGFSLVALFFVAVLAVPLVLIREGGPRPRTQRLLWLSIAQIAAAVPAFLFGVTLLFTASAAGIVPLVEVAVAAVVVALATRPASLEWARLG